MSARAEILGRVRAALGDVPAAETPGDVAVDRPGPVPTTAAHVELFAERVADYQATVVRCTAPELGERLAEALRGLRVVVPPGLDPALVPDGALVDGATGVPAEDTTGAARGVLTAADLDAVDAVLTTAALGIAETGTIVLDHGAGQGRRALTLVPDTHVCVVRTAQVVADVPAAVAALDPTRPLTWISGPSATSDIELDRVEGVHGPRTLVVLLVD